MYIRRLHVYSNIYIHCKVTYYCSIEFSFKVSLGSMRTTKRRGYKSLPHSSKKKIILYMFQISIFLRSGKIVKRAVKVPWIFKIIDKNILKNY